VPFFGSAFNTSNTRLSWSAHRRRKTEAESRGPKEGRADKAPATCSPCALGTTLTCIAGRC
jgi:hypothetical protein